MATVTNMSVVGTKLKVEYLDGEAVFINDIVRVKNESLLYGLTIDKEPVYVYYGDVSAATKATQTLTLSGNLSNGDTVTIGTKVYTAQDTLTEVDGNFHIGASASATIDNLAAAINLTTGVSGTDYAAAMTINSQVVAVNGAGDTLVITAKVAGTAANAYATTETSSSAAWGASTMAGGAANGKFNFEILADALEAA